jgi:hypothetical protein
MAALDLRRRLALAVIIVAVQATGLTLPAGRAFAQDTHVRMDSTPGSSPANQHVDVAPPASAFSIVSDPHRTGTTVRLAGYGPTWQVMLGPPNRIPFGVGVYEDASVDYQSLYMSRFQLTWDGVYNTKCFGSFEVRQIQRSANGAITRLWLVFQYRGWQPNGAPFNGEIRWNADTSLYVHCPNMVSVAIGDSVSFAVTGIDTRGRPVTLSAPSLPAGASLTSTGPGTAVCRWPVPPATEGVYPVQLRVANDQGLSDTTTTWVRVVRPMWLRVSGDAADPVSRGITSVFKATTTTLTSGIVTADSSLNLGLASAYNAVRWISHAPSGFALREGTYGLLQLDGTQAPNESGLLVEVNARSCASIGSGTLKIRRLRSDANLKITSLWAEASQSCTGYAARSLTEICYNCDTTLDVQAPAVVQAEASKPVTFGVESRTTDGYPAVLTAHTLPGCATFTDRGDGTGTFSWDATLPAGHLAVASFIATSHAGARDTVTTRIAFRRPFQVTLQPVAGSYIWLPTASSYDLASSSLAITDNADSSLTATLRGKGQTWTFQFIPPGGRSLNGGVYDQTAPDYGRVISRARLSVVRGMFTARSFDARFHIRRLARASDGSVSQFWATFSVADQPGVTPEVGEIRYNVDTTLYVTVPATMSRPTGAPFHFDLSASEAGHRGTQFSVLVAPPGAALVDRGDGTAAFDWSGSATPGDERVVVRTLSDAGVADTTTVKLRTYLPATFRASSAVNDPVALGVGEAQDADSSIFAVKRTATGGLLATVATPANYWTLGFWAKNTGLVLPGVYTNAARCGGSCSGGWPSLDVTDDGRFCSSTVSGQFDIRKLRVAPDGAVRSLWVRFSQACAGSGGVEGELCFGADTALYLRVPSYVPVEFNRSVSVLVSAVDTRGLPVAVSALSLPDGATLLDRGDGTAMFDWVRGASTPGTTVLTWLAQSSDGHSDTCSTTIEAFRTALFTLRGPASDPIGIGQNIRLTGADGLVTTTQFSDKTVSVTFAGGSRALEYFFQAPFYRPLREGIYTRARLFDKCYQDEPGLHVKVDNRLCEMDSADFHVRHLRRDASGAVVSLWVTFAQRCTGSTGVLTGEVRVSADTSVYIEAPSDIARWAGETIQFSVRAVDTRGRAVTLRALDLPADAAFVMRSADAGDVSWCPVDGAGSIRTLTFEARSEDGAIDTTITQVRTFARDFMTVRELVVGSPTQAVLAHMTGKTGTLSTRYSGSAIELAFDSRRDDWVIQADVPYDRAPSVGRYENALDPNRRGVPQPGLAVGSSVRYFPTARLGFQIRKITLGPAGSIQSLWMTYRATGTDGAGIEGEFCMAADTSFYLDAPADVYTTPNAPVAFDVSAMGALASDAVFTLVGAPPGLVLTPSGPGVATIGGPGISESGTYPLLIRASGAAGTDSMTTWVHVAAPSFVEFDYAGNLSPPAPNRRLYDTDGVLACWRNPDNSISTRFTGAGYAFQIDFSRADHERIVPGDYPVTGSIPPWGTSPNGIYMVWSSLQLTPRTGAYHVADATYVDNTLVSLWLTFAVNDGATPPRTISGEIHVFAPDVPTPVEASLVDAAWSEGQVHVRWLVPRLKGSTLRLEHSIADGEWGALRDVVVDANDYADAVDRDAVRGVSNGYRLVAAGSGEVVGGEAWVAVPVQLPLALDRVGANPGTPPLVFALSMPQRSAASLELLDVLGRVIDRRAWSDLPEGRQLVALDGVRALAPGCYFARLRVGDRTVTRSLVLLR